MNSVIFQLNFWSFECSAEFEFCRRKIEKEEAQLAQLDFQYSWMHDELDENGNPIRGWEIAFVQAGRRDAEIQLFRIYISMKFSLEELYDISDNLKHQINGIRQEMEEMVDINWMQHEESEGSEEDSEWAKDEVAAARR